MQARHRIDEVEGIAIEDEIALATPVAAVEIDLLELRFVAVQQVLGVEDEELAVGGKTVDDGHPALAGKTGQAFPGAGEGIGDAPAYEGFSWSVFIPVSGLTSGRLFLLGIITHMQHFDIRK